MNMCMSCSDDDIFLDHIHITAKVLHHSIMKCTKIERNNWHRTMGNSPREKKNQKMNEQMNLPKNMRCKPTNCCCYRCQTSIVVINNCDLNLKNEVTVENYFRSENQNWWHQQIHSIDEYIRNVIVWRCRTFIFISVYIVIVIGLECVCVFFTYIAMAI